MIRKARFFAVALVFTLSAFLAQAQVTTATEKQLAKVDFAISGAGIFSHTVSGPVVAPFSSNTGQVVSLSPSNTLGALVTLRYIKKPYIGLEANYAYARFTQNYSTSPFGTQATANEGSVGYVATPPHKFYGFQPFVSAGLGAVEFKPTPRGGEGLPKEAVASYYYSAGIQQEYLSSHFGLRASFRQVFYLAPDFYQNYLSIQKHTFTTEPTVGFYVRF